MVFFQVDNHPHFLYKPSTILGPVAGANGLMTGNYLTTTGGTAGSDREMARDLGLTPTGEAGPRRDREAKGAAERLLPGDRPIR